MCVGVWRGREVRVRVLGCERASVRTSLRVLVETGGTDGCVCASVCLTDASVHGLVYQVNEAMGEGGQALTSEHCLIVCQGTHASFIGDFAQGRKVGFLGHLNGNFIRAQARSSMVLELGEKVE